MKKISFFCTLFMLLFFFSLSCNKKSILITGELRQWHTITLTLEGPQTNEQDEPNPFLSYRLSATFSNGDKKYSIRGFYAADGNAAESSAESGNKWQVRFTPDLPGNWKYKISFRQGEDIAISDNIEEGIPLATDGVSGSFRVLPSNKSGRDFRAKGRLSYTGSRYLQFRETGDYFLKGGADSPENFLGYVDFDGTFHVGEIYSREGEAKSDKNLHNYLPHLNDWNEGDPTWKKGKGKSIIGALNYLASKGMNSVYFLTMNISGDGNDVWPYTSYNERLRFDISKLDQWEIVFSHMDKLGIMMHVVTQETENELLLDNGDTGLERKLYYLELISRFSHHLAITWNMGEENGFADFSPEAQNRLQQKTMIKYMKDHDPYNNFVVLHSHSNRIYRDSIFNDLLGYKYLDGPSLQISNPKEVHQETINWIEKSINAGKPWVVNIDEIGPHWRGIDPDDREDNNQDSLRCRVLWANLMAGGGGVEWYFGYKNHDNDLSCEDWHSRDRVWDFSRYALEFFQQYLPFYEMEAADELTDNPRDYCLAKRGIIYAIYLPEFSETKINLIQESGEFRIHWYNPQKGGQLADGSVSLINGDSFASLGEPPVNISDDCVVLIKRVE